MIKWILNLKIAQKLTLGFGTCIAFAALIAVVSIAQMSQIYTVTSSIVSDSLKGEEALGQFQAAAEHYRQLEYRIGLEQTVAEMDATQVLLDKTKASALAALADYQKTITDPQDTQNLQSVQSDWASYIALDPQYVALAHTDNSVGCSSMLRGSMASKFSDLDQDLKTMADWKNQNAVDFTQKAAEAFKSGCLVVLTILFAAVVVGVLLGLLITGYLRKAVTRLSDKIESLNRICITNLSNAVSS